MTHVTQHIFTKYLCRPKQYLLVLFDLNLSMHRCSNRPFKLQTGLFLEKTCLYEKLSRLEVKFHILFIVLWADQQGKQDPN